MDCHRKSKFLPLCLWIQLLQLTFLAILISLNNASASVGIYTAISSKLIFPYSNYSLSVSVEPRHNSEDATATSTPLQFTASIVSIKENYTAQEISIVPGASGVITFDIGELSAPRYNLTLKINDGANGEIENLTTIYPNKKDKSILLHTDKSMYKPGETVQFRVVVLNRDMKPFPSDQILQVKIFDPEQNVIKIWENAEVKTGLFNAKLQLSSEPVLGDWKIEVKPKIIPPPGRAGGSAKKPKAVVTENEDAEEFQGKIAPGVSFIPEPDSLPGEEDFPDVEEQPLINSVDNSQKKTLKFTVAQYVLPKFQVTIKLPNFITFNDTKVPVEVIAKYTYGKGVKGECTLVPKLPYYRAAETDKVITSTFPIDGSAVTDIDIKHLYQDGQLYDGEVNFEAQVTESVTGKSQNGTGKVYMHRYPYKIEQVVKEQNLKPGLPFTIVFKIQTQDNIPINDSAPNALKISHGFSYESQDGTLESPIVNGLVSVTFATPTNELIQVNRIEVTYKELTHNYYVPQKYNSESKTYMSIKLVVETGKEDELEIPIISPVITVNSKLRINVNSTKTFSSINYLIHGRSEILLFEKVNLPSPMHEHVLEITCPPKSSPEARIVVYLVLSENGEVVADSLKFNARNSDEDLDNYLNITLSHETREPGQNVSLQIDSKPNSLIALRGVDQSVLLLQEDVDITQKSVDQEIKSRNDDSMRYHRIWGGSNAFQVFEQGGLTILTNAKIKVERGPSWYEPKPYYLRRPGSSNSLSKVAVAESFDAMPLASAFGAGPSGGDGEIRVRTDFPETWLWEEITLNGSNSLNLQKSIPDSLTSWIITGYSLNTDSGLGVLQGPRKVTTFRPFFISLNLPYSVVKGEILVLQVLVHNYLSSSGNTSAEITLDNSKNQFQFNDRTLQEAREHKKTVSCPPNAVTSVTFVIVPTEFGSIMLNVKGVASQAGDALSQALRVKPPGQQQRRTASALISSSTSNGVGASTRQSEATLTTSFPTARVQGADNVKMSFISDILGSTIANLDKMLQIPTGCGEQNMLNFVADIVILDYLKHTHNLNALIRAKAINFLETGYQRELTYRHSDGSFSAFGASDSHGSTWLTAFVVRSFIQAKQYITVDDKVIEQALEFLAKQQFENGGLFEHGKVLHSEIQGGSNSDAVALTAYTVLAFLEATQNWNASQSQGSSRHIPESTINDYKNNVHQGLEYITSQTKSVDAEDPYALILTTYALHLADHPLKNESFDKLDALATRDGGLMFWETKKNRSQLLNQTEHYPWEIVTKPVSVEMTGYVLLTYILRGQLPESFPLVRWLLKERNAKGGFHSTQDTVVGLTALAKYAELTKENFTDIEVQASYSSENRSVVINNDNAEVLQEFALPKETSSVHFHVSGRGTVLAQLTWTYYVQNNVREPAFYVDVKATSSKPTELELNICTSYLRGEASNMAIIEVNLPSGYSVDRDTLGNLQDAPSFKRYDTENKDTKLEIYLDSITSNTTCVPVTAVRSFKVGKQVPAYVHVYDYYDTTKSARAFYEAPNVSICDICRENNDCEANNCV